MFGKPDKEGLVPVRDMETGIIYMIPHELMAREHSPEEWEKIKEQYKPVEEEKEIERQHA